MKRKNKSKEWKLLRKQLREAKHKIKKLEKSAGSNRPTFHGFNSTLTTTLNGYKKGKHVDVAWGENE